MPLPKWQQHDIQLRTPTLRDGILESGIPELWRSPWMLQTLQHSPRLPCPVTPPQPPSIQSSGRPEPGTATQDATTRRLQALLPGVSHKHITELTIDYISMVIFELLHSKASSSGRICARELKSSRFSATFIMSWHRDHLWALNTFPLRANTKRVVKVFRLCRFLA